MYSVIASNSDATIVSDYGYFHTMEAACIFARGLNLDLLCVDTVDVYEDNCIIYDDDFITYA